LPQHCCAAPSNESAALWIGVDSQSRHLSPESPLAEPGANLDHPISNIGTAGRAIGTCPMGSGDQGFEIGEVPAHLAKKVNMVFKL
jgi:hypothetical protein